MRRTLALALGLSLTGPIAAHAQGVGALPPANDSAAKAAATVSAHINELITTFDACRDVDAANGGVYVTASSQYIRDKTIGAALARADEVMRQEARRRRANPDQLLAAQRARQDEIARRIRQQARTARGEVITLCRELVDGFRGRSGPFRSPEAMFPGEMNTLARWR